MTKKNATPEAMRKAYERYLKDTAGMEQMHAMHFYETVYGKDAAKRMKSRNRTDTLTRDMREGGEDWKDIYKFFPAK
jgi:hypothetical protein